MHPRTRILLCLFSFLLLTSLTQAITFNDQGFSSETVLTLPAFSIVGATFAPDGRIFVWQREGVVRIYKNGQLLPTPFVDITPEVNIGGDRGLLGLAVDPNFAQTGYVYLLYVFEWNNNPTSHQPRTARLTRVTADPNNPDVALPGSEITLLGTIGIPSCSNYPPGSDCIADDSDSHSIGTVQIGPDGTLYVGSGDGSWYSFVDPQALRAQDLESLNGKILRINPDGTAPVDNPFYDGTNSNTSKVFAYGLRNPFRFTLDPIIGEPLIGDVGWNDWEEVDRGKGANFGWPCFEGNAPQAGYQAAFTQCQQIDPDTITYPIYTYNHSVGATVVGGVFYTDNEFPVQYQGNFFFADYVGNWIKRIVFDSNQNIVSVNNFATNADAPVSFALGPDGWIYYVSITTGELRRIKYGGPFANASANPTSGYSPLNVAFSSAGSSDPNGQTLTFLWDFGDGTTSTQANPNHTYTSGTVKTFVATLTVTNEDSESSSDSVSITVGSLPPTAVIDTPPDGTVVNPGDVVNFSGHGTDPDDGNLPASAMHWTVYLHHDDHIHTFLELDGVTGGSFTAQDYGAGTYSYEIDLTVTDSSGLTDTDSVDLPINSGNCPTITISPATLPDGAVGTPYSQTVSASGGNPPYTYTVSLGTLPPGLALNGSTGVISGTPTTAGTYNFTITATDADTCTGVRDYSIDITCASIVLAPPSLADGTVGDPYSETVTASGGTAPYTYAVTAGALPPGLSLDSATGDITGTPTLAGTFNFVITATDANTCTGSRIYFIAVADVGCPVIDLAPATLPDGVVNSPYTQTIVASGGSAPYTYAVSSGALPDGLSLDSGTGVISGTPTAAGSFDFTIMATDSNSCTGSRNYTININATALFFDDFEDGVLDPNWTYIKPTWTESGGSLQGSAKKKAIAVASPVFSGCLNCTIQTSLMTQGGPGNRVWLLGWYIDKNNKVELLMKEEQDVWVLKQRSGGSIVTKAKAAATIDPNVPYAVVLTFDGTQFTLSIDGNPLITLTAVGTVPSGTVGFQAKATTGFFDYINVN
jgi:glucose/arabinose dehydrogenase